MPVEFQCYKVCLDGSSYDGYVDSWGLSTAPLFFSCFLVSFPLLKILLSPYIQSFLTVSVAHVQTGVIIVLFWFFISDTSVVVACWFFSWGVFQKSEMIEILFNSQCLYLFAKMAIQKKDPSVQERI